MWLYVGITLLVIGLSFLIRDSQADKCKTEISYQYVYTGISRQKMLNAISMVSIFTVLFGVSACRLNVGNDYAKYVEFMHQVYSHAYAKNVKFKT